MQLEKERERVKDLRERNFRQKVKRESRERNWREKGRERRERKRGRERRERNFFSFFFFYFFLFFFLFLFLFFFFFFFFFFSSSSFFFFSFLFSFSSSFPLPWPNRGRTRGNGLDGLSSDERWRCLVDGDRARGGGRRDSTGEKLRENQKNRGSIPYLLFFGHWPVTGGKTHREGRLGGKGPILGVRHRNRQCR